MQALLEDLHSSDEDLLGVSVLLVDDDARNILPLAAYWNGAACGC